MTTLSVAPAAPQPTARSTARPTARRVGLVLTGLAVAFLAFDVVGKLVGPEAVRAAMAELGWAASLSPVLGIILAVCTALYVATPTARLGALLLTGYLGGAVAANLRVEAPLFTHVLFPLYVAAFVWGGLALRDPAVRAFFLPRRNA